MRIILRPINLLLLAIPAAILSEQLHWGEVVTFVFAALSLAPLSGLMAAFTDAIADKLGDRVGGLLEATFGNAAFLILGFYTLREGLITVVKASIAGALIANTLFVLGLAFFLGNWNNKRQLFNKDAANNYAKLLALAVVALVLPAIAVNSGVTPAYSEKISAVVAVVLIILYIFYLMYDLFHIKDLAYLEEQQSLANGSVISEQITPENAPIVEYRAEHGDVQADVQGRGGRKSALQMRRERGREASTPIPLAAMMLGIVTVGTFYMSEVLVSVTRAVTSSHEPLMIGPWNIGVISVTPVFVGLVVLPLIGTVSEHISALRSATSGRSEVTVAVTAGASIQVALLAAPLFVLLSFFISPQPMALLFSPMELAVFALATFLFYLITEDGEGTWLEGALLLGFYFIFAGTAFFLP